MAFFQDPPQLGNPYDDDRVLQATLRRLLPKRVLGDIAPSLQRMGELTAGPLAEIKERFRHDLPQHIPYDPWGNRIDAVRVSPAWDEFARVAAREGVVSTAYERAHGAHSRVHQFALAYLFNRSTQIYTCPLAMTDGCARTLELIGPAALRDTVLPHLVARDPAMAWTSGQWMTERTGGSDVGLSETVARPTGKGWALYGTKWFTSAVTCQVALTLARPEGNGPGGKGLALFFIKLRDADGRLQNIQVNRLKDKLGTRYLPTAELSLDGTPAEAVAGLNNGVRNMASMLNITRTWNAVSAASIMRHGLALARDYARRRVAFRAQLADKPLHQDTLATLAAEYEAAMQLVFHNVAMLGREEAGELSPTEVGLLRVLQPVAKLLTGKQAVACASEVLECFGGAGYVEDTGLPELLRDAQVLSIWEGTTNVLALETYRALRREDALQPLVKAAHAHAAAAKDERLVTAARAATAAIDHAAGWLAEHAAQTPVLEASGRRFAMTVGRAFALALLVEHAQWVLDTDGDPRSTYAAQRFAAAGVDQLTGPAVDLEAVAALGMDRT